MKFCIVIKAETYIPAPPASTVSPMWELTHECGKVERRWKEGDKSAPKRVRCVERERIP